MALVHYESEFSRIRKVVLYRPLMDEIEQDRADAAMYMEIPNQTKVLAEFDGIVKKLRDLNIEVIVLTPREEMPRTSNMIFLRDVAFTFHDKIIIANMKHPIRQREPEKFKELLLEHDIHFADSFVDVDKDISMEGADFLVIAKDLIYTYTGSRTDERIVRELAHRFEHLRNVTIQANIHGVPQHILGGVHILDNKIATRRIKYCQDSIENYKFIDFEEDDETRKGFALNILTISPGEILMPANNPITKNKLEANGIRCHEVEINEIHKMGGGLACMILPLIRDNSH